MSAKRLICSHVESESKKNCGRYLGNATDATIFIRCPKCGNFTPIEFNSNSDEERMKEITEALKKLSKKGATHG